MWLDPKELLGLPFLVPLGWLLVTRAHELPTGSTNTSLIGFGAIGLLWLVGICSTLVRPIRRWLRLDRRRQEAVHYARDLVAVSLCTIVYSSLMWAVPLVQPRVFDAELVQLDRLLFGGHDPALVFDPIVSPTLTWLFSIFYFFHFPLFYLTPLVLFLQGRRRERADVLLALMLAMYLGFVGYFLVPALGPLYGLAHLYQTELSANVLRDIVHGHGVAIGTFPSLHAGIAAVVLVFARRDNKRLFWVLLPVALAIWSSTLYLRYHYVIDLLAGWSLALFCCWLSPRLNDARQAWLMSGSGLQARVRIARRAWSLIPGRTGA
jgi:membrane-associated phospholipid phosphatase